MNDSGILCRRTIVRLPVSPDWPGSKMVNFLRRQKQPDSIFSLPSIKALNTSKI